MEVNTVNTRLLKCVCLVLASFILMLPCGCTQQKMLTYDDIKKIVSGNAIDEVLTTTYKQLTASGVDTIPCDDPDTFAKASVGLPFQMPSYDTESGKFVKPENNFWYCPIISDGQILAMLTLTEDDVHISVTLDGFLASSITEVLAETDSPELVIFWCDFSVFALDSTGQVHLLNAFPEKELPTFPDNLNELDYPATDFSAGLTTVAGHLTIK